MRYKKILIITKKSLKKDNATGITINNIFNNYKGKLASLFFTTENIDNNILHYSLNFFYLLKKLSLPFFKFNKKVSFENKNRFKEISIEKSFIKFFRENFNSIGKIWEELYWVLFFKGDRDLYKFIKNFNPEVIFIPSIYNIYPYSILEKILKINKSKLIVFLMDDYLNLETKNIFKKIFITLLRKKILKIVKKADVVFTISELMQKEYKKCYNINSQILYKGFEFKEKPFYKPSNDKLTIVYSGNLLCGRWESLILLNEIIKEKKYNIEIDVYSQIELPSKIKEKLLSYNFCNYKGFVEYNKLFSIYEHADLLLFLESTDFKDSNIVRLSFSTKLVDYFYSGRPILAIGCKNVASINYLQKNDAAFVCGNENELKKVLELIYIDRTKLEEYSYNAWNCGVKNHQINTIYEFLSKI